MDIQIILSIIATFTTATTLVAGGGWFIDRRQKKELEIQNANQSGIKTQSDYLDLAAKMSDILKNQFSGIEEFNSEHKKEHDALLKSLAAIKKDIKSISIYLNGDFAKWKKEKGNNE